MRLKRTLARLLVSLGFLRLMDFILAHSEQARSQFTLVRTERLVKEILHQIEKTEAASRRPETFSMNHRQRVIGA